jgi:hypothetical protein
VQPRGSQPGLASNVGLGYSGAYLPREVGTSYQYSFGVQRELPLQITADVSYVGNLAKALPVNMSLNFVPLNQLNQPSSYYVARVTNPLQNLLPNNATLNGSTIPRQNLLYSFPQYTSLGLQNVSIGRNRYDAVQFSLRRRFQAGLTFQVNYQISKTLEQLVFLNPTDQNLADVSASRLDKRLAIFDVPQKMSALGVFEFPFGRGRKWGQSMPWAANFLLGGWELGWNVTLQSGFPIDFPNAAPLEARSARLSADERSAARWFDTSLFPRVAGPAPFTLRTFSSRFPDVRFMDYRSLDLNLSKDFPIFERMRGQIRVTAINLTNTPYITQLQNNNVTNVQFGQLRPAQNNDPRALFLDLRFIF